MIIVRAFVSSYKFNGKGDWVVSVPPDTTPALACCVACVVCGRESGERREKKGGWPEAGQGSVGGGGPSSEQWYRAHISEPCKEIQGDIFIAVIVIDAEW